MQSSQLENLNARSFLPFHITVRAAYNLHILSNDYRLVQCISYKARRRQVLKYQ